MKKIIHKVVSHPMISGSTIIVAGSMVGNIFNYLTTLSMGRLLRVEEYGILASLISLFNIFIVFQASAITVFSKFAASFLGQGKESMVGVLFKKGTEYLGIVSLYICLPILIFSPLIAKFLHISNIFLVIIIGISLFFNFLQSAANGILQGLLKFISYSFLYIFATVIKFVAAVVLVFMGLHVLGATLGILISALVSYAVSVIFLLSYIKKKNLTHLVVPNLKKELYDYGLPVLLSGIGLTLMYTMDIILVKHFFSAASAGQYGALSLMGRSIFFVVSPITFVFFPLVIHKRERKEKLLGTLILVGLLVGIPSLLLAFIYFTYPGFILSIFFPAAAYKILAPYLGYFSIFILAYTFCFFLNSYYLSLGKTEVWIFTMGAAILEVIFLVLFHSSLFAVITVVTLVAILLLITLLLYYCLSRNRKYGLTK